MKKRLHFAVFGVEFDFYLFALFGICIFFIAGLVVSLFVSPMIADPIFSPLIIYSNIKSTDFLFIIFHSFLYFMVFIVIALIFATSYFGFIIFPVLIFVKGLFSALSIDALFRLHQYMESLLIYAPLLTMEIGILLIYFAQCMCTSFSFAMSIRSVNKNESSTTFIYCLKQFTLIVIFMSIMAVLCGFAQYFV
ncbi:MAG: hypothetical protein RSC76_04070 [Oscillospiraceae bacterium]